MQRGHKPYTGRAAMVAGIASAMIVALLCLYLLSISQGVLLPAAAEAHLSVMVKDDSGIDPASTARSIESMAGVKSVYYVDSTEAEQQFSTSLDVDIQSILGKGSIPSSYIVTIDPTVATRRNIERIKAELASTEWVESVSYERAIVDEMERTATNVDRFTRSVASLIIALVVALLFVLARLNVGVMQNLLPDAPIHFLRPILLRRAVVDSVVAALFTAGIFAAGILAINRLYPTLCLPFDNLPLIACVVLLGGFVANILFTYISTLKISSK